MVTSNSIADFGRRGFPWKAVGQRDDSGARSPQGLGVGMTKTKGQSLQRTAVARINLLQLCLVILSSQLGMHFPGRKCLIGSAWTMTPLLVRKGLVA